MDSGCQPVELVTVYGWMRVEKEADDFSAFYILVVCGLESFADAGT